ncbi:MAG: FliH/SctL family protein [Parvibaculum sp.]
MAEAIKFTFDEMFHNGAESANTVQLHASPKRKRWTDEDLEAAKAEAKAEGMAEALASQDAQNANMATDAANRIAEHVAGSLNSFVSFQNELQADGAMLALSIARKLADVLISLRPEAEIEAVIRECLTHLNREPRLVIRVNDTLRDALETSITQAAHERGMGDKIMIVGEANIALGDCDIEWSDGGAARNRAELDEQAADIVLRYIETLTGEQVTSAEQEKNNG